MGIIQERIRKIEELKLQINAHPMRLTFKETTTHYVVLYPAGMCLDGAQVEKGSNKATSLQWLLNAMEQHWNDSVTIL